MARQQEGRGCRVSTTTQLDVDLKRFITTRDAEIKLRLQWELGVQMRKMAAVWMRLDNLGRSANHQHQAELLGGITKAELNERIKLLNESGMPLTAQTIMRLGNTT